MYNKEYALMAILLGSVASVALVPVYAQAAALTVQTDKSSYTTGDTIKITGNVGTIKAGQPVLIQVLNEKNNPAGIDQAMPAADGSYTFSFKAGGTYYSGSGTYTVKATYAGQTKSATFTFTSTGGGGGTATGGFKNFTLSAGGKTYTIQYQITGGSVNGMSIDGKLSTLTVNVTQTADGTLTLKLPRDVIDARQGSNGTSGSDTPFAVFLDGAENVEPSEATPTADTRTITIDLPNGTQSIDIVGTVAVPEFGAIAAIILAIAIVGTIVATARYSNKFNFPRL